MSSLNIGEFSFREPESKLEELRKEVERELAKFHHYHGTVVRKLFLVGALFMAVIFPFIYEYTPHPFFFSILFILILVLAAGFINPYQPASVLLNAIVSIVAVTTFEYYAVQAHAQYPITNVFFWTNLVLAVIFFFAAYYCIKTLRGFFARKQM